MSFKSLQCANEVHVKARIEQVKSIDGKTSSNLRWKEEENTVQVSKNGICLNKRKCLGQWSANFWCGGIPHCRA